MKTRMRLRRWLRLRWNTRPALGGAGAAGIALLALAAAAMAWVPQVEERSALIAAQTAAARAQRRQPHTTPDAPAEQIARFVQFFPTPDHNVDDLRALFRIAAERRIRLARGDYGLTARPDLGLTTYEVVLPIRSSYGGVRAFIAAVLNDLPHASLKSLRLDRSTAAGLPKDTVDAHVHLALTYREE